MALKLPTSRAHRLEALAVLLIATLCLVRLAVLVRSAWAFTTDDTYITLRYARHLAEGHGLAWNVGEPLVEGYSNFLYVLLAALFVELDPVLAVKVVGVLSLAGSLIVTYLLARLWLRPIAAVVPPLLLLQYQGTVYWAVSGLETATYGLTLLLALYLGLRAFHDPVPQATQENGQLGDPPTSLRLGRLAAASLCALAAALLRPEGPIVFIALGAFVVWRVLHSAHSGPASLKQLAAAALPFCAGYAAYFAWRVAYFGALLPNTVYCKAAYEGDPWILVTGFLSDVRYLPLALVPLFARPDARNMALLLPVGLYLAILHGVSPTVAQLNRHFLAVFPLVYVAAAIGVRRLVSLAPRSSATRRPALATVLTFCLLLGVPGLRASELEALAGSYAKRQDVRARLGSWLETEMEPDDWYAIGDAGIVPWVSGGKVIDLYCLNCREMTTAPVDFSAQRFADWLLTREPRFLVMHNGRRAEPDPLWPPHPEIASHARFARYSLRERFNTRGYSFNYWVYERNVDLARID